MIGNYFYNVKKKKSSRICGNLIRHLCNRAVRPGLSLSAYRIQRHCWIYKYPWKKSGLRFRWCIDQSRSFVVRIWPFLSLDIIPASPNRNRPYRICNSDQSSELRSLISLPQNGHSHIDSIGEQRRSCSACTNAYYWFLFGNAQILCVIHMKTKGGEWFDIILLISLATFKKGTV